MNNSQMHYPYSMDKQKAQNDLWIQLMHLNKKWILILFWYWSKKKTLLLFLFRNPKEKWETHFCPTWHLILHTWMCLGVCKSMATEKSKCQNVTWFSKDLLYGYLSLRSKKPGISCGANFNKKEGNGAEKNHQIIFWG